MQLLKIIKNEKKNFKEIKPMNKFEFFLKLKVKLKVYMYSQCLIKIHNFTDQSETKAV